MPARTRLTKALQKWIRKGGSLSDTLGSTRDVETTEADVEAICAALDVLRAEPDRDGERIMGTCLSTLVGLFQNADPGARKALTREGLPRLRVWIRDRLEGKEVDGDDFVFILKIFAAYRQREDVDLIATAAKRSIYPETFVWGITFMCFDREHPHWRAMVEALRDQPLVGTIRAGYLVMANRLASEGVLDRHPLDSSFGREQMALWFRDEDERNARFGRLAGEALPFIDPAWRGPAF